MKCNEYSILHTFFFNHIQGMEYISICPENTKNIISGTGGSLCPAVSTPIYPNSLYLCTDL